MPYALRTFECLDCNAKVQRRLPSGSQARCHPCAVEFSAEVQRQLHAHQGPYWDKWVWRWTAGTRLALRRTTSDEVMRVA